MRMTTNSRILTLGGQLRGCGRIMGLGGCIFLEYTWCVPVDALIQVSGPCGPVEREGPEEESQYPRAVALAQT